ncbi:MAG TPA: TetR family transcriptional regulator [Candidatus Binataceae bacterium]|jgi:TetR/AcrR family transcriptional regulator|nr:TetR family transcriptional regulator [Candidatus Binataceae bacterium]
MHNRRTSAGTARSRDLERTRGKILAAALSEFVARGFDGSRTKAIARRARVHEWMVFYCFKSKRDLYREVLRQELAQRTRLIAELPEDFPDAVETAFKSFARNRDVLRLFQWEALTARKGELITAAPERRDAFRQGSAWLQGLQRAGVLPANLDLVLFRLAIVALGSFPFAFPQMVELAAGVEPTDPSFQQRWTAVLRWFVERALSEPAEELAPAEPAPTVSARAAEAHEHLKGES